MSAASAARSKLVTLEEAAGMVGHDSLLGVGGVMDQMVPVALIKSLIRRRARGLHCVTVAGGLSMDLLVAGGCAAEISCAIVSFEDLGTSRLFRRRVESGELAFHEHSELTMITRLNAAASGLPFLPTRAALGTDIIAASGGALRPMECPFTGAPLIACHELAPDVSVIHVERADEAGNAQLSTKHIWHDVVLARAGRRTIVTAEEIVSTEEIRRDPTLTVLPSFAVDAVVEAPLGAAPTMCLGRYPADHEFLRRWIAAGAQDVMIEDFLGDWLAREET
jgi:glutaconate CoA-transferase subunit A